MKLYVIKEQPIGTKESRNAIVEWIGLWQNKICSYGAEQCDINPFIRVYSFFWYFPEGAVSILTEYCEGGSLQVDNVGVFLGFGGFCGDVAGECDQGNMCAVSQDAQYVLQSDGDRVRRVGALPNPLH